MTSQNKRCSGSSPLGCLKCTFTVLGLLCLFEVLKFKMASVVLSQNEKVFIKNGVFDDFRLDGRARRDYRYFEIETGIVSNTNGSARLRLVRIYMYIFKV